VKAKDAVEIMLSLVCCKATWHENIHPHYNLVRWHVHVEYAYVVRIA
jgi:hypothetical protein